MVVSLVVRQVLLLCVCAQTSAACQRRCRGSSTGQLSSSSSAGAARGQLSGIGRSRGDSAAALGSLSAALQGRLDGAAQQQQLSRGRSGAAQRHQQQPGRLSSSSTAGAARGLEIARMYVAVCLWPGAMCGAVAGCGGIGHTCGNVHRSETNKKPGQLGAGGSAAQECGRPLRLYCLGARCRLPCFGEFFCSARQRLLGDSLHLSALSERPRLL